MIRLLFALSLLALPAFADKVDEVFSVWDANGDGILDATEIPDPNIFAKVDTNKDGKVTRDEVRVFLNVPKPAEPTKKDAEKKKKAKPDAKKTTEAMQAPRTVKERVDAFFKQRDTNKDRKVQRKEYPTGEPVFKAYDRNKDNALSRREVTSYVTATLKAARARPRVDNFFDLFDLNRDKKVTKREYKGGPRSFFRRYDHNRDGAVTEAEINMGPDQRRANSSMRGDREFMADGPTQAPKRGLLDRYDKDGDGRITLKEMDGAESVLHRLDKNGDGVLSGAECR